MVSNPMQKKARNSFLIGMVITLIICILVGALLYFVVIKKNQAKQEEEGVLTYAYRLKTNVKSGQEITSAMVESIIVTEKAVPAGAFASKTKKEENGKEKWLDKAFPSGYKSKVDLKSGTILSNDLLYMNEAITSDLRYVEYNMLTLSTTVNVGSYIDIRLTLPNGQDLIVVSGKEVKSIVGNTIGLELTEDEILLMENAIVEAYIMTTSKIYTVEYVEPGTQIQSKPTIPTYVQNSAVHQLILENQNIVDEAKRELEKKYKQEGQYLVPDGQIRNWIDSSKNTYDGDEQEQNLQTKLQEEIENAKAAREAYLNGLTSY